VAKVSNQHLAAVVASKVGEQFDPVRPWTRQAHEIMKGWLTVTSAKAPWVELVKEAYDFVNEVTLQYEGPQPRPTVPRRSQPPATPESGPQPPHDR
jgi:hypothetical protein